MDIGDATNLHPTNKREVGRRLAIDIDLPFLIPQRQCEPQPRQRRMIIQQLEPAMAPGVEPGGNMRKLDNSQRLCAYEPRALGEVDAAKQ